MTYKIIQCACGNEITMDYQKSRIDTERKFHTTMVWIFICEYCGQEYEQMPKEVIKI